MKLINVIDTYKSFTFIDLFAGIGGFHLAAKQNNGKCIFACEIDRAARQTYQLNHKIDKNIFAEDITKILVDDIPKHDVLFAGFPCQPFSQAGLKSGFDDIRGTLFFHIANIIKNKQPKAFFLENVRYLLNHNSGKTFTKINEVITQELGYSLSYKVVKASDFGLPQHRPRLFMIGFKDTNIKFDFPDKIPLKKTMSDIFNAECNKRIGFTLRVGGRGSKINDRRNWDSYLVNNEIVRLTPKEGALMMGFPKNFIFPVSETQAMKQLGNSVAIDAISNVIKSMVKYV